MADTLARTGLVVHALSLLCAGAAVQASRFHGSSAFPLTVLFCLLFAIEAAWQAAPIFSPEHTATSVFFANTVRPLASLLSGSASPQDVARLAWLRVKDDDEAAQVVLRLVLVVFACFFVVSRAMQVLPWTTVTPAAATSPAVGGRRNFKVVVLAAMGALLGLVYASAGDVIARFVDEHRAAAASYSAADALALVPQFALLVQRHVPAAVPSALTTLALLLASLTWPGARGEFVGLQHVLALRWAGVALSLLQVAPHRLGDLDVVLALWLPVLLVGAVFVAPKFARSHPFFFACVWAVVGLSAALMQMPGLPQAALVVDLVHPLLLPGFFVVSLASLVACGGLGISGSLLACVTLVSVHAKDLLSTTITRAT